MKVLSLGAVAMDVVMECSALPEEDGFALVWKEYTVPGGSASNVSVALQRHENRAHRRAEVPVACHLKLLLDQVADQVKFIAA